MHYVESQFFDIIRKYSLINDNDGIIVGFSGGADSCALLYLLNKFRNDLSINITALHINHNLRGEESLRDLDFARKFASNLSVDFLSESIDVLTFAEENKLSVEMAARELRYKAFYDTLKRISADKIAVAHNRNDLAETVLLRLFTGTGVSSVKGIPVSRDRIIRPLLYVSRDDIERYLADNGISFIVDSSNLEDCCQRNIIRRHISPIIEEKFPRFKEKIASLTRIVASEDEVWDKLCGKLLSFCAISHGTVIIHKKLLSCGVEYALIARLIRKLIADNICPDFRANMDFVDLFFKFAKHSEGNKVIFENNYFRVVSSYGDFVIEKTDQNFRNVEKYVKLLDKSLLYYEGYRLRVSADETDEKHICKFNARNTDSVIIRKRKDGDRFSVFKKDRSIARKKVKDFFIDKKFSLSQRERAFIIEDGKGKIIAVFVPQFGFRVSAEFYTDSKSDTRYISVSEI